MISSIEFYWDWGNTRASTYKTKGEWDENSDKDCTRADLVMTIFGKKKRMDINALDKERSKEETSKDIDPVTKVEF